MLEAQVDMIDDSPSGPGEFIKLGWTAQNITTVVIYTLEDSELWRSESIGGGEPTMTRVAEHINSDPTKTSCDWDEDDNVLTFTVTATVGDESETRVYEVKPRPG